MNQFSWILLLSWSMKSNVIEVHGLIRNCIERIIVHWFFITFQLIFTKSTKIEAYAWYKWKSLFLFLTHWKIGSETVGCTFCIHWSLQSLSRMDSHHLKKLMRRTINSEEFSYDNLARLMEFLMDKYDHDFDESSIVDTGPGKKFSPVLTNAQQHFKFPFKQLMIWSILMLR